MRFYGLPSNPMKRTGKIGSAKAEEMKFWTKDEYLRFAEEVMDKPARSPSSSCCTGAESARARRLR